MIPNIAHFVWLGPAFPWLNELSVRSAITHGKFDKAIVHHDGAAVDTPSMLALAKLDRVELRRIDLEALKKNVIPSVHGAFEILEEQPGAAARSDVLRKLVLLADGGVYLDIDTVTVRAFDTLCRSCSDFYGTEPVAYPGEEPAPALLRPLVRQMRSSVRNLFRQLPSGWQGFRRFEAFFPQRANGAILGAEPQSKYLTCLLEAMVAMTKEQRNVRYSIGPYLLQRHEAAWKTRVRVVDSKYFYPLGPTIAEHWFRMRETVPPLERVLFPETLTVHWYASNATNQIVGEFNPEYVAKNKDRQLLSALAARVLDGSEF